MNDNKDLVIVEETEVKLGSMVLESPKSVIAHATSIATELAQVIDSRKLFAIIGGNKFVKAEGWSTLGAMLGVVPVETETKVNQYDDFYEYEAKVELIRVSDGAKVGGASAVCSSNENNWKSRPRNVLRSMAITRATGKAFRLSFSWIVVMAGYSPTPAEEMDGIVDVGFKKKETKKATAKKTTTKKTDGTTKPWDERHIERLLSVTDLVTEEAAIELLDKSGMSKKASTAVIGQFGSSYAAEIVRGGSIEKSIDHARKYWQDFGKVDTNGGEK